MKQISVFCSSEKENIFDLIFCVTTVIMTRTKDDAPSPIAKRLGVKRNCKCDLYRYIEYINFKHLEQLDEIIRTNLVRNNLNEVNIPLQPIANQRLLRKRKEQSLPNETIKNLFMKKNFIQSDSKQTIFSPNVFCRCELLKYRRNFIDI